MTASVHIGGSKSIAATPSAASRMTDGTTTRRDGRRGVAGGFGGVTMSMPTAARSPHAAFVAVSARFVQCAEQALAQIGAAAG